MKMIALILTIIALLAPLAGCYPGDVEETVYFHQIGENTTEGKVQTGYFHDLYVDNDTLYIGGIPYNGSVTGNATGGGSTWYSAAGTPGENLGITGDWYLDDINGDYFEKTEAKSGNPWVYRGNLKGDQGISGKNGEDGYTPIKGIDYSDGLAGYTPIKGVDYFDGLQGVQGIPGSDANVILHESAYNHSDIALNTIARHSHSNISILNSIQEAFTTALKTSYDWLVTNITVAWKATVDNFIASKGSASGLAPLDSNSKVPSMNLGGEGGSSSNYLNGAGTWATLTYVTYTLTAGCASQSTTTDAQTMYWGGMYSVAPSTTANRWRIYIPTTGHVTKASVYSYASTAGSNENWSMYIRYDNTLDTLIQTLGANTNDRVWSNTGLNIAVTQGHYIEIKEVQPTWVTNPVTVTRTAVIYIAP